MIVQNDVKFIVFGDSFFVQGSTSKIWPFSHPVTIYAGVTADNREENIKYQQQRCD